MEKATSILSSCHLLCYTLPYCWSVPQILKFFSLSMNKQLGEHQSYPGYMLMITNVVIHLFLVTVKVNLWIDVNHCIIEASQFCIYAQARLEVMGKKAKNTTYISGNEAERISKEVSKVEMRRTVKSTLCNERSSRSHCMLCCIQPPALWALIFLNQAFYELCLHL